MVWSAPLQLAQAALGRPSAASATSEAEASSAGRDGPTFAGVKGPTG